MLPSVLSKAVLLFFSCALISSIGLWILLSRFSFLFQYDRPTERGLHHTAKLRGGGLVIVLISLVVWMSQGGLLSVVIPALLIGVVGWIDDRKNLSAKFRLAVHFSAAMIFVASTHHSIFFSFLMVLWIAWSINFYNFMDGSDGICAAHAASALVGVLILSPDPMNLALALPVAGATAGFLIWNWHPAKVFMGDVGSGFLGFVAGLSVVGFSEISVTTVLFLHLPFVVDSGVTLFRRTLRGASVTQAHREHAYQKLILSGRTHRQVAGLYLCAQWLFCFPLAWVTQGNPAATLIALSVAASLFTFFMWKIGAGTAELSLAGRLEASVQ